MALSPPLSLSRSPSSSSLTYCLSEPSALDYPSPPDLAEQPYKLSSMYGSHHRCSMTPPMDSDSSLPPLDALCRQDWSGPALLHSSSSSTAIPSILSSNYDHYEDYDAVVPPVYEQDMYSMHNGSQPPTPGPLVSICRSPHLPGPPVSYSSTSSQPASLTPRIKMEHGPCLEASQYPSPRSMHITYTADSGAYGGGASGYLSDGQSSWRTSEYQPSMDPDHYYDGAASASPFVQDARGAFRVTRPRRATRRLTTREEANFQCEVKGCGKLFSRSYNFRAHMETHDEKREYPFPCLTGDCNKKFVRKTDLQRHHQSVHMKERNHKCDYCGRLFARKDTLRRHMEDGCSKRFDIGTLDIRSEHYEGSKSSGRHLGGSGLNLAGSEPGGLPPMSLPVLESHGSSHVAITTPLMRSRNLPTNHGHEHNEHPWRR